MASGRDDFPATALATLERERDEARAEVERLREAWEWLASDRRIEVDFHGRVYGDDEEPDLWRITRKVGSINDREWETLAHGKTPLEAVENARAARKAARSRAAGRSVPR